MVKKSINLLKYIGEGFKDTYWMFLSECRNIIKDTGVMIIFFGAVLIYPLLYNGIYKNEAVYNIPVAVADISSSAQSRELLRKIDATQEVKIAYRCTSLAEAQRLFESRKVHGVIYIPGDYGNKLADAEQATISVYNDMSSFLYYKALTMAVNYAVLDENHEIQVRRYNSAGVADEQSEQLIKAMPYNDIALYNPGSGFASFLLPALLILILHQTLFFGIGMLAGTAREENSHHSQIPEHLRGKGIFRVVAGKAASYFLIFFVLSAYVLAFIPRIFNLPHIGNVWTLAGFIVPFLLATIFFSMTVSVFVKNRETGLISFLFFTLILLFLSGFSWPRSNMSDFWRYFSYIFPSTHGIQGYIKINSAAAELPQVRFEYISLWIQTGIYFILATMTLRYTVRKNE